MRAAAVLVVAALAGCAQNQTKPDLTTGVKTITVEKAVPVTCVDINDIPPEFVSAMPTADADVARKAAGASADVRWLASHYKEARALLEQCAEIK